MAEPTNQAATSPTHADAAEPSAHSAPAVRTSLFPVTTATSAIAPSPSPSPFAGFSFTPDLAAVNEAAVSSHHGHASIVPEEEDEDDEEEEEDDKKREKATSTSYQLLESSESDEGERGRKRRDEKKRKKRKRKKAADEGHRKLPFNRGYSSYTVRAGAPSEDKSTKDYYVDSRGDPDNLAFGSLYRMEVPRYKLHNALINFDGNLRAYYRSNDRASVLKGESDVDALDSLLRSNGRYWSAKYSALERHKNLKRTRIMVPEKHVLASFDDFIPFPAEDTADDYSSGTTIIEESWEDEVLRRTRDFNKMTRENPHNIKIWLEFAEFQDKVASRQPQKGARLQTLEKKISILEKAVELNPDDEDLLLCLLKAYQGRDSTETLVGHWERIIMQHSGSYKLWREFLRVVQMEFSKFKVSEQRKMYGHAIQALSAAARKTIKHGAAELHSPDKSLIEIELGIVNIFLSLCRFEWQTGYRELSTALFQAEIEYSLLSPSLQLTEQSKLRLFELFWNSNGARVGEDGALGWSTWMEREEEQRQRVVNEVSSKEEEQGGWTGWFVPEDKQNVTASNNDIDTDVNMEDVEQETDVGDLEKEDDVALLKRLGINVDADANYEAKDSVTWARWSELESARDCDQWMPIRTKSGSLEDNIDAAEGEEEELLSRVILFEDVGEYLFSLHSAEARFSLVCQFVDFFGGDISYCVCTNSSSWTERILSLEDFPGFILEELKEVHKALMRLHTGSVESSLDLLLHDLDKMSRRKSMMKFLRNAILLCMNALPRNFNLQKAVLIAEEQSILENDASHSLFTPCQGLAKRLLKSDRQDVLLCGVYAQREAAFGNVGHARKVFDMAILSVNGLSQEIQSLSPILYFWYCEMELANCSSAGSDSVSRILHILSCLGSGSTYSPYRCQPSSVQLLRAHQGFKERVKVVQSAWACGVIDESSIAFVCSAALFEELTTGWTSGVKLLSKSLAMVRTERSTQSYYLEHLLVYHVRMLKKHHQQARLSTSLHPILQGLKIYPSNLELFRSLVELSLLYSVPNRLRQMLDEHFQKKPSAVVWIFAMSLELGRSGSRHRIHGLFERSLANDELRSSALIWRCYIAYQIDVVGDLVAAKRIFFRAIHACPWSKQLWLDGFSKLNAVLTAKELSDLQEVMRDKELNLRTDIYEILLQDEFEHGKTRP